MGTLWASFASDFFKRRSGVTALVDTESPRPLIKPKAVDEFMTVHPVV